jgi:hypothetical protein
VTTPVHTSVSMFKWRRVTSIPVELNGLELVLLITSSDLRGRNSSMI